MSNKRRIAVDIDDVLADHVSTFIEYSNSRWGSDIKLHNYNENCMDVWQVDMDEYDRRWHEYIDSGVMRKYGVVPGAQAALKQLSKDYDLVVLTARSKRTQEYTYGWLEEHFPDVFSDVVFAGIWDNDDALHIAASRTKAEAIKDISVGYLIDDQPKHCFGVAKLGVQAILYGGYPWQSSLEDHPYVSPANDWEEVVALISGRER